MTMAKAQTPGARLQRETLKALRVIIRRNADQAGSTEAGSAGSDALLSAQDFHEIEKVIRRHKQNTDRLHRLSTGADEPLFEDTRDHYLRLFPTRLCAAIRAFAKKERTPSLDGLIGFANSVDVTKPSAEPVHVLMLAKEKGGFRPIMICGIQRMAQQFVVRDLLTVMGVDSEFD